VSVPIREKYAVDTLEDGKMLWGEKLVV